jgi:hypothetical protein
VPLLGSGVAFCLDGEAILTALRDSDAGTRRRALESPELAACYSPDADEKSCPPNPELFKRINQELIRLLQDPDPSTIRVAAQYLSVSTDERAVQPLAGLLRDRDEEVRRNASSAFIHIRVADPQIVRDLERRLEDPNKFVRMNAAMALSTSGTHSSVLALKQGVNREVEPDVKDVYAHALRTLQERLR